MCFLKKGNKTKKKKGRVLSLYDANKPLLFWQVGTVQINVCASGVGVVSL